MRTPLTVRDAARLAQAHDLLNLFIDGQLPPPPGFDSEGGLGAIAVSRDAMCWVLEHPENPTFGQWLADLDKWARACGLQMKSADGQPAPPFLGSEQN